MSEGEARAVNRHSETCLLLTLYSYLFIYYYYFPWCKQIAVMQKKNGYWCKVC